MDVKKLINEMVHSQAAKKHQINEDMYSDLVKPFDTNPVEETDLDPVKPRWKKKDTLKDLPNIEDIDFPDISDGIDTGTELGADATVFMNETPDGMGIDIKIEGTFRHGGLSVDELLTKLREFWKTIDIDT